MCAPTKLRKLELLVWYVHIYFFDGTARLPLQLYNVAFTAAGQRSITECQTKKSEKQLHFACEPIANKQSRVLLVQTIERALIGNFNTKSADAAIYFRRSLPWIETNQMTKTKMMRHHYRVVADPWLVQHQINMTVRVC